MEEHWQAGYHDAVRTLRHPEVLQLPDRRKACAPSTWRRTAANSRAIKPTSAAQRGERHEGKRSPRARVRHAADQPGLSDRALSLRRPGVSDHHLPDRPGEAARRRAGAARVDEPLVKYEFIRMPNSTGFGDYTETGQVIPVSFQGRKGGYTHCMFLNDHPPIAGGRELWGFPKKLANPTLRAEIDTLVGTLDYGPVRVATATMGYKHKRPTSPPSRPRSRRRTSCSRSSRMSTAAPRICELVEYYLEDVHAQGRLDRPRRADR